MEGIDSADIVFIASCNVDLISYVKRMPRMGETLMGNSFKTGFGGKGANKAIACSRLGSRCAVVAKLGNDLFGRDYLKNFEENKIQTDHVFVTNEAATGVAPICVDENGDNSILVILGANLLLSPGDIDRSIDLMKSAKILVTNLEIPVDTVLHSLKLAKESNVATILNFAPATTESTADLLANTDYLILNEIEAEQLSNMPCQTVPETIQASLSIFAKHNVRQGIVVTLGGKGVVYTDAESGCSVHKTCTMVKVVDSSGAGDAFVGSFAHYLNSLGKEKIDMVLELAGDYATKTVQEFGTQSSYPRLNQM